MEALGFDLKALRFDFGEKHCDLFLIRFTYLNNNSMLKPSDQLNLPPTYAINILNDQLKIWQSIRTICQIVKRRDSTN